MIENCCLPTCKNQMCILYTDYIYVSLKIYRNNRWYSVNHTLEPACVWDTVVTLIFVWMRTSLWVFVFAYGLPVGMLFKCLVIHCLCLFWQWAQWGRKPCKVNTVCAVDPILQCQWWLGTYNLGPVLADITRKVFLMSQGEKMLCREFCSCKHF
jgi:hypothetical protein